jgi:Tol biopolymer transport system component
LSTAPTKGLALTKQAIHASSGNSFEDQLNLERDFNNRAGFTSKDDALPKRLTTVSGQYVNPSFSADGSKIVFVAGSGALLLWPGLWRAQGGHGQDGLRHGHGCVRGGKTRLSSAQALEHDEGLHQVVLSVPHGQDVDSKRPEPDAWRT